MKVSFREIRRLLPLTVGLLVAVALFFSSCASHTEDRFRSRKGNLFDALLGNDAYQRAFLDKTVERSIYSEFEGILKASLTPFDGALRNLYVKEMKSQFRITEDEETKMAQELLQEDGTYFVFIVSLDTREPQWNDLDRKSSMWRIFLTNEDASIQVAPERIEVLATRDEKIRYFHPTMSDFNRGYRVRFERKNLRDAKDLKIVISGVKGAIEADFANDQMAPLR